MNLLTVSRHVLGLSSCIKINAFAIYFEADRLYVACSVAQAALPLNLIVL
jgi:hypothetical protein